MSKFKIGEKIKVIFNDGKYDGEIFGVAEFGGLYNEKYAVSYIDMGGDLINDVISGENLKKVPENKFKQGDILDRKDPNDFDRYVVAEYDDNKYKILSLNSTDGSYIFLSCQENVENDFVKVGKI